jgi:hypothetical protein
MGKRSAVSKPVYRAMIRHLDSLPTCVVAGPNRRMTWLYVHATTPTVLRLHPPVVRFLCDVLAELPEMPGESRSWLLPRDTSLSHPQCVTYSRDAQTWLYVFAATPSTIPLAPRIVAFLREALSDLPATAAPAHTELSGQAIVFPLPASGNGQ